MNAILTFCHLVKISDLSLFALIYTLVLVENGKITHIGNCYGLYMAYIHLGDSLAYQVPVADTDIYKCSFSPDH